MSAYAALLVVCLLGVSVRTTYEVMKRAGRIDTKNRAVFWVVFAGMAMMLGSWIVMGRFDPVPIDLPLPVRWLGLLLVASGIGLAVSGVLRLRGLENVEGLQTGGIYGMVRHPMYTGFILWIAGWTLYHGSAVTGIVALACIGDVLLWRWFEERDLLRKYGQSYADYRRRTLF